ncbi:MAG: hypothetical protein FWF23_06145 [Alphaproteobacteria bacterium]|nr:hypothetical protein [Alphaproteobacteria bacterium]MCL2505463.1 hypothetical protein [Alphaproteobacteria bacterium]
MKHVNEDIMSFVWYLETRDVCERNENLGEEAPKELEHKCAGCENCNCKNVP